VSDAINLQRSNPDFVRTVSCIRDSYYIFLGETIQLEKTDFQPLIHGLKAIGTDIEKAIFNGFASQIKDLKLFLCPSSTKER